MAHPYQKAPFPYFGGKADAAPIIWDALGDVHHYVEPFCGSLITLLLRPHPANRTTYSESVNDIDGLLVNMWRAMQFDPDRLAEVVSWPVTEVDLTARHLAIVRWQAERDVERLLADPKWYDVEIAGYWLYGICAWIGSGWCSGKGPWIVGADGRITRRTTSVSTSEPDPETELDSEAEPNSEFDESGVTRKRPHLSNGGQGVHRPQLREPGVARQLPHLSHNGQGVNHPSLREPGVVKKLPYLHGNGQGVNHPSLREPGVERKRPHLSGNGQGVNHPSLREPGVARQLPHFGDHGKGVHRGSLREPGVMRKRPHAGDDGRGVHRGALREPGVMDDEWNWHPMVMPELLNWFRFLSARLRHVRITCGDWKRVVTPSTLMTLSARSAGGVAGVFLDPPYTGSERDPDLYTHDSGDVSCEVREWCLKHGNDPKLRIVLAGFAGEGHEILEEHGWQSVTWFKQGLLKGGYAKQSEEGHQQHRERLWLSPHCLRLPQPLRLWDDI